jgi:uncharacterized damage-inducible protein DinB
MWRWTKRIGLTLVGAALAGIAYAIISIISVKLPGSEITPAGFRQGTSTYVKMRDILLHVVNHTTYHRGHVADMLYHQSMSPPTTDLPVFLREEKSVGT